MIRKSSQSGFTIVELLIATTVFSTILLVATSGIIHIGKIYYRGVVTARTQETARSIIDDVSRSIQLGGTAALTNPATNGSGVTVFCVGNVRYTFDIDKMYSSSSPNNHVLWVDQLTAYNAGCTHLNLNQANPSSGDPNSDTAANNKARELLAHNMRVAQFEVIAVTQSLASVRLKIIYGDDTSLNAARDACLPIKDGGQFCAVSELEAYVKKRL